MKIFVVLLSIYFLGLNLVPCDDSEQIMAGEEKKTEFFSELKSDNSLHTDFCTPFCHCHCCHVHVITFDSLSFEPFAPLISAHIPSSKNRNGFEIADYHFQPPRI